MTTNIKPRDHEIVVSFIIAVNKNSSDCEKFLSRCLTSIEENIKVSHEVLIEDGSKTGPALARNKAIAQARGRHLLFLDYDTVINSTALHRVVEYLDEHPDIGGGQLKLLRLDNKQKYDSAGEKLTPWGFLAERAQEAADKGQFDQVEDVFSGKGAAMLVRRKLFEQLGGFDPDYFMYWEEPDLSWRIWKAGYRFVFLPQGTVYHAYGSKEKKVSREWDIQITYLGCRNQIITMIKNATGWKGARMILGVILGWLGLLGLFGVRRDWSKAWAILRVFSWLILRPRFLWNKRKQVKQKLGERFYADGEWLEEVTDRRGVDWYLRKVFAYITGKPY